MQYLHTHNIAAAEVHLVLEMCNIYTHTQNTAARELRLVFEICNIYTHTHTHKT